MARQPDGTAGGSSSDDAPRQSATDSPQAPLLQGSISRALIKLALPIAGANVLQTVYQLTDTFWLGRLGPTAVAAVSLAFPVLFLMISLGGGLAVAGAVLAAQYFGSGDRARVNHVAAQTLLSIGAISVVLWLLGYVLTPPVITLFGPAPEVAAAAQEYLQISFLGLVLYRRGTRKSRSATKRPEPLAETVALEAIVEEGVE